MGFEMYQRVVEEAVAELKDEEFHELVEERASEKKTKRVETIVETDIEALIPDIYIEHDAERLDVYRRLYTCTSREEIDAIRKELADRFGDYPEEVEYLLLQVALKLSAAKHGFVKLELSHDVVTLLVPPPEEKAFYEGENAPFQNIMKRIQEIPQYHPRLRQDGKQLKLTARIKSGKNQKERLEEVRFFLEQVLS
jgi:transcription-repair coupling factor (superfamily II helicase)